MNWASFGWGFLAAGVAFVGTSASVSIYALKHPQMIMRRMMRKGNKPQSRKAA